jgi:hypothetical protein
MNDKSSLQKAALFTGVMFLAVGILGFIPGITTNYGDMSFAGHESEAELLGIFQVSILHNLVHVAFGIAGIALARSDRKSYGYLLYGGISYFMLFLYGIVTGNHSSANFVPVNGADDALHLFLSVAMVGTAFALRGNRRATTAHA